MNPLDKLVADMNNQNDWYVTGPDEGECTAVPHEWEQRLGLPIVYGNAIDTYDNAPDDLYEKELNTPAGVPRPGAIMVWGEYAPYGIGQYGHTAVALAGCDANTIVVLEQNWGVRGVRVHSRDYGGVKGWFYPRVLEPVAPTPEPNPPQQDPPPPPPAPDPAPEPAPTPAPVPTPAPAPSAAPPVTVPVDTIQPPPTVPSPPAPKPTVLTTPVRLPSWNSTTARSLLTGAQVAGAWFVAAVANPDLVGFLTSHYPAFVPGLIGVAAAVSAVLNFIRSDVPNY